VRSVRLPIFGEHALSITMIGCNYADTATRVNGIYDTL
jgi:hypothetical protein